MLYAIIDWARAVDSYGKCQIGQQDDSAEIGNREAALIALIQQQQQQQRNVHHLCSEWTSDEWHLNNERRRERDSG